MVSNDSAQTEKKTSQEGQSHEHYLLLALSRAAQAIQGAHTPEDFYFAVGREIEQLGAHISLLLLDEKREWLSIVYTSYSSNLIEKAEKLTGLSIGKYRVPIVPGGIIEEALKGGGAFFFENTNDIISEVLPPSFHRFIVPLVSLFDLRQGILAPLRVDGKPIGLMKIDAPFLNHEDVTAMDSFAGHIAAGLHNVQLLQKLQDELTNREQVEDVLTHNRNLLLALSRAAHAVQLVREPDDIYRVVGEQIKAIGYDTAFLKFGADRKDLKFHLVTLPKGILQTAEKFTGIKAQDFNWKISPGGIYDRMTASGRAEYIPESLHLCKEALPGYLHHLTGKLIDILNIKNAILAPLQLDGESYGFMYVFGSAMLSPEDLPAVESFAAQVSVGLRNANLTKQLEGELWERRQAEEALRISQSTFEGIFNSVTETIYIQDESGVFLDVNGGAEKMYGYPREYFIGRTPEFLSAPGRNDLEKVKDYVAQAFDGRTVDFEFWGLRKDGAVFPKDVRLSPGVYFGRKVVIAVARDITEKKKAEETLKRQYENLNSLYQMTAILGKGTNIESEFNAALDSLQNILRIERVAILLYDPDGIMRFKAWRGLSEDYRKTVEGHTPWDRNEIDPQPVLVPDVLSEPSLESLRSLLQKEGIGALGFIPLVHQGRLLGKFMIYFDEPHEFSADEIQLARTIAHHVSFAVNRKGAEDALTRSEAELRALFASMQDTVLVIDRAGVYRSIATTSTEKLYIQPDQVVGKHISAFFSEDKVRDFLKVIGQVLDTGATAQIEYEVALQGQAPWFESTISRLGADLTIWVARDITERKKIESALVHSEKRYRLLAESIADVVWVLDVQTRTFTYVSPSVQNLLGYSADELTGTGLDRVLAPDSLAEIEAVIPARVGRFLDGDKTAITEIYQLGHVHKDGRVILAEVVNTVVWNERNELEAVGVTRDITQRKRAEDELRLANLSLQSAHKELQLMFENEQVLARTDSLTHLFNRRYFFELSSREFAASIRYKRPLSIIMFDVDGFKTANDTFGHALGDDILIKISQAAKSHVREVDILARYGGDEFTVLLPETSTEQAFLIAERIRISVEAAEIQTGETPLSVTLSLGIAEVDFGADKSIETIIRRADQALYTAKQKGRNHTVIHSED